jgi:hypothetical protein
MSSNNISLKKSIDDAEQELSTLAESPFSPAAFETVKEKITQYIADLIFESAKIAKRHSADTVSSSHVEQASNNLVSSSSKKLYRHFGTIGGILLGAGVSNILAMTTSNQFSTLSVSVTSALSIMGAFLIALYIAKE